MVRGIIVHKVLEKGLSQFDVLWEQYINEARVEGAPPILASQDQIDKDREVQRDICRLYFNKMERDGIQVLEREAKYRYLIPVQGEKQAYQCEGTIDAITIHPDTPEGMVEIEDFKTGERWCDESLNRDIQFAAYCEALNQKTDYKVNRVFWCKTSDLAPYKTNKRGAPPRIGTPKGKFYYPVRILREDMYFLRETVHNIIRAIQAGIRYPAAGGRDAPCKRCEWERVCPKFRVGYEKPNPQDIMDELERQADQHAK
jgi:hypothetical protein